MKNLSLKTILLGLFAMTLISISFTSCSKEQTVLEPTEDIEISASELSQEIFDTIYYTALFPVEVRAYTNAQMEEYTDNLTKEELKSLQKDYVKLEFMTEQGLINENNSSDWENVSFSSFDFSTVLNSTQLNQLNQRLDRIDNTIINSRSNCWYDVVSFVCYWGGLCFSTTEMYCSTNTIVLFEKNNCKGVIVGLIHMFTGGVNFKNDNCCDNDEAKSMLLFNMEEDQIVTVFDDPNPTMVYSDTKDDYNRIDIKQDFDRKKINSFDEDIYNQYFHANHKPKSDGKIDGKVSKVQLRD